MTKVADNVVFCARHGWVEIVDSAEMVPGVFVPVCTLCGEGR